MIMKVTTCLIVCLAIIKSIQGDTIMRMEKKENYMERMNMKNLMEMLEDTQLFRVKRDQMGDDCVDIVDNLVADSGKCIKE